MRGAVALFPAAAAAAVAPPLAEAASLRCARGCRPTCVGRALGSSSAQRRQQRDARPAHAGAQVDAPLDTRQHARLRRGRSRRRRAMRLTVRRAGNLLVRNCQSHRLGTLLGGPRQGVRRHGRLRERDASRLQWLADLGDGGAVGTARV
eukprot:364843-Chlamydomonas_euryale.AAC.11